MGKVKYSPEMKEQTVKYILESGKSASKAAVELGIDKNTVCRWVREYRETHQMPTYEVERKIRKQSADELIARKKNKEVIGYEVSKNIDSELSMNALGNAIALRGKHKGLVFHSDRGSQYSSKKYKAMLNENGITGSMSAPGPGFPENEPVEFLGVRGSGFPENEPVEFLGVRGSGFPENEPVEFLGVRGMSV